MTDTKITPEVHRAVEVPGRHGEQLMAVFGRYDPDLKEDKEYRVKIFGGEYALGYLDGLKLSEKEAGSKVEWHIIGMYKVLEQRKSNRG